MSGDQRDIVIVGAPRSGTNMLRDVLTSVPGVTTWPCDEINPIWRHGNRAVPHDELTPEQARPAVATYVRGRFDRIRDTEHPIVVEKTCANSLRMGFVRTVLPDARYVWITRDGLDAAASAMRRWHAPFDLRYTAAKARFVPWSDVIPYGVGFVAGRLRRTRRDVDTQVSGWWGPRPADFRALMTSHPLDELCVIQWQRCVEASYRDLQGLPDSRLFHLSYEEFVRDPQRHLADLGEFLGVPGLSEQAQVADVSAASIGKGRAALGPDAVARLERLVSATLDRLGYAH